MTAMIFVRGGGDLASGAVLRLARAGLPILITELAQPLAVRRLVSFAEAVYSGAVSIEGIQARLVSTPDQAFARMAQGEVAVLVDPPAAIAGQCRPLVILDARMTKRPPESSLDDASLVIGLGPGFTAGENCHAVIETKRGPFLGRVIWEGMAEKDTGLPDPVAQHQADRVLRSPADGIFQARAQIGEVLAAGQIIAEVNGQSIHAEFPGVLRGLLHSGLEVQAGLKIGDLDPRLEPRLATLVSDKALAIGGGVLEAVLTHAEIRRQLWK